MAPRLDLQSALKAVLGSSNVYFDGPQSTRMEYPAIVYKLNDIRTRHADNHPYMAQKRYQVIVIDPDPDSPVVDKLAAIQTSEFDRYYKAENLHHFVFNLFF